LSPFRKASYFFSSILSSSGAYLDIWVEFIEVLIHSHPVLLQFRELLLFQFERTMRYVVSYESSFELVPGDSTNILVRVAARFPPFSSGPK
jgi:hypothetical protein